MRALFFVSMSVLAVPLLALEARADTVKLFKLKPLGTETDFTGELTYIVNNTETGGQLIWEFKNTSSFGVLTGFAFGDAAPKYDVNTVLANPLPAGWDLDKGGTGVQFGSGDATFKYAVITGPNFNGGNPLEGIQEGATKTFVFDWTATAGFNPLNIPEIFFNTGDVAAFAVRFQSVGANGQDSEKTVGGFEIVEDGDIPSAPLPASALGGAVVLSALALRRRR